MQKVDAQSNYIEKADATAKAQAKQLLDQNKRIKQSEEEIQHVKTTQMIDKIAHKNIHGPREKGHMSEEEIHNKEVFDDNLSETTQRGEQIKKTTKSVKSSSNKLSVAQPHFSKLSTYDEVGIGTHTTCNLRILPCALNGQMPRNLTIFFYSENDVSNIQKDTSKILSLVSRNQYNGRSRSRTPSPSRRSDVSHVKKWDIIAINVQIKNQNRQLELTL